MCHDHQGFALLCALCQHTQAALLLVIVHAGGGLIQQPDRRVTQHQARERHQLFLATTQALAPFSDLSFKPARVTGHKPVHAGLFHGLQNHFIPRVRQTDQQVFTQTALKQPVVLLQVTNVLADHLSIDV